MGTTVGTIGGGGSNPPDLEAKYPRHALQRDGYGRHWVFSTDSDSSVHGFYSEDGGVTWAEDLDIVAALPDAGGGRSVVAMSVPGPNSDTLQGNALGVAYKDNSGVLNQNNSLRLTAFSVTQTADRVNSVTADTSVLTTQPNARMLDLVAFANDRGPNIRGETIFAALWAEEDVVTGDAEVHLGFRRYNQSGFQQSSSSTNITLFTDPDNLVTASNFDGGLAFRHDGDGQSRLSDSNVTLLVGFMQNGISSVRYAIISEDSTNLGVGNFTVDGPFSSVVSGGSITLPSTGSWVDVFLTRDLRAGIAIYKAGSSGNKLTTAIRSVPGLSLISANRLDLSHNVVLKYGGVCLDANDGVMFQGLDENNDLNGYAMTSGQVLGVKRLLDTSTASTTQIRPKMSLYPNDTLETSFFTGNLIEFNLNLNRGLPFRGWGQSVLN